MAGLFVVKFNPPDDGTIYVTGTTTTFGAGNQDAFVLHLPPTGKKLKKGNLVKRFIVEW